MIKSDDWSINSNSHSAIISNRKTTGMKRWLAFSLLVEMSSGRQLKWEDGEYETATLMTNQRPRRANTKQLFNNWSLTSCLDEKSWVKVKNCDTGCRWSRQWCRLYWLWWASITNWSKPRRLVHRRLDVLPASSAAPVPVVASTSIFSVTAERIATTTRTNRPTVHVSLFPFGWRNQSIWCWMCWWWFWKRETGKVKDEARVSNGQVDRRPASSRVLIRNQIEPSRY